MDIKNLIEILLKEIELQDLKLENGEISIEILEKNINHPEYLKNLINKINEGEGHLVISFDEKSYEIQGQIRASINLTNEIRSIKTEYPEHHYFLIQDIERLTEIKEQLEKKDERKKLNNKKKVIKIQVKKDKLVFNGNTGDFKYNKIEGNFTLDSQEYSVFWTILNSNDYLARYEKILENLGWANNKTSKSNLTRVIRNIKRKLKILPKNKKKNPDLFDNDKNVSYRIILS